MADDVAEDRSRAEVAAVRAAEGGDHRGDLAPGPAQPLALVGGVVEVAPVGQGEGGELALAVVHDRVVDVQAVGLHEQPGVRVERQLAEVVRRGPLAEVVEAEAREAHVGLAAKDRVDVADVAPREHRGQGAAGDDQAAGEVGLDHLGDAQGVARQADHGGEADDVRPVGAQVVAQALERAEGAVEDPRLDPEPRAVERPGRRPPAAERASRWAPWCGSRERPGRPWTERCWSLPVSPHRLMVALGRSIVKAVARALTKVRTLRAGRVRCPASTRPRASRRALPN